MVDAEQILEPGEDDWTELQPDTVSADFVERTLEAALAAHREDRRWRAALATYAPPPISPDFVDRTLAAVRSDKEAAVHDFVLAALAGGDDGGDDHTREIPGVRTHWLRFAAVAAIMLAILGLPFVSSLMSTRTSSPLVQLTSHNRWAARLTSLADDGLTQPVADPILAMATRESSR